jgi:rhodanese-related sulfurtransferase
VQRFEGEDGAVARVVTNKRTIEADLVVLAAGVSPNTGLAKEAGIECDPRGAIIVDEYMRTNDPDIYSGGDCVTIPNLVTGKRGYYPLGSMANRQGRVIGTNLAGGKDTFPGAVGGWVVKLFDQSACGAGLTIENAVKEGFDAISVHVEQFDRAHFFPEKALMSLELVVDKPTRRVLGIQGMSELGDALTARINAVVPLLKAHSTIEEVSNLEVVYSPPFASAMDIVNALGNVTENVLEGRNHMMTPAEFAKAWGNCDTDEMCFIDTRLSGNAQPLVEKYPGRWHNIPNEEIRARINEVPADKPIVVICNTGLRSYEAMLLLNELGRGDVKSAAGGMVAQKKIGSAI